MVRVRVLAFNTTFYNISYHERMVVGFITSYAISSYYH